MIVRRETPADIDTVHQVTTAAFAKPDRPGETPFEDTLLRELRGCDGWMPALSLVATGPDGQVVGHVLGSRGHVEGAPVVAVGPVSVHPAHQRRGVGLALVHTLLGAADAMGEPMAVLVGSPVYYSRFGFRPAGAYDVVSPVPEWGVFFQVRALSAYDPGDPGLRGAFAYAEPFNRGRQTRQSSQSPSVYTSPKCSP
ncbi:GNAT family N-acetyltransferase [Streptosporangium sandarakinum]|uniref:GNAT family N-acetyltransferase n=1 Tax=Streptosporangium TaxID=2000 RepID=UPI0031F75818